MKALLWVIVAVILAIVGYIVYDTQIAVPAVVTVVATTTAATDLPQIIPDVPSVRYTDPRYDFSIYYPSTATLRATGFDGFLPLTQTPLIAFTLNPTMFQGTNLIEAGLYVGATSTPSIVADCTSLIPNSGEVQATSTLNINGATFTEFDSGGAAAGNFYQQKIFREATKGSCLEFAELLHSGDIANYPSGTVTAFDEAEFSGILDAMLHTLVLNAPVQK